MNCKIEAAGIVQGVGFRPFVARLAREMKIEGTVCNAGSSVFIEARGTEQSIRLFARRLQQEAPPGAMVQEVRVTRLGEDTDIEKGFRILPSRPSDGRQFPLVLPDLPTCPDCLAEMRDPGNRRYRHPFISCTSCGPRYSILKNLPYDRETTSMNLFPMCSQCAQEYVQEGRRRHAQTIACHHCGPELIWSLPGEVPVYKEAAYNRAKETLQSEKVLAVKGIGGYQLICTPFSSQTVALLRQMKGRERKPFAIMFPDLFQIKQFCRVGPEEERLLLSPARPIVLLASLASDSIVREVAGESPQTGAFLPYSPLHQMLADDCGPLIVTSANLTEDPICFQEQEIRAFQEQSGIGVLWHSREILTPLDDSVVRADEDGIVVIRRSRGYVPLPVEFQQPAKRKILAMGGDLKTCFALAGGGRAYLSQYFGDLENRKTQENYLNTIERMIRLFEIHPEMLVRDRHPGYISHQMTEGWKEDLPVVEVQHHHAHIASVMAEHGLESCIGVAYDGTGYGMDGTVWGGEFLLCQGASFERVAHLRPVPICGGDQAARSARQLLQSYLASAGVTVRQWENFCGQEDPSYRLILAAVRMGIQTVPSSSMGRLFDAVSAVLGVCEENTFEGECAQALEARASAVDWNGGWNPERDFDFEEQDGVLTADGADYVRRLMEWRVKGEDPGMLARQFHEALIRLTVRFCEEIRSRSGENKVALSGGVFVNRLLAEGCIKMLKQNGFEVYRNHQVPCNDGGICLGQVWVASRV